MNPVKFSALTGIVIIGFVCLFLGNSVTVSAQTSNTPTPVYSNTTHTIQKLVNAKQILTDRMVNHQISDIPIFVTWVDRENSTLVVGIEDNTTLPLLSYQNKLTALLGNVAMKVRFGHLIEQSCTSQNSQCDPMIGGINVQAQYNSTYVDNGTLNLGATDNEGRQGFITASHVVGSGTGQIVGQPDLGTRVAGQVLTNPSLSGTRYSDSAFVLTSAYSASPSKIYRGSGQIYNVINEVPSTQTPYQTSVYMMGAVTGLAHGYIAGTGITVTNLAGGTLLNQVFANYASYDGDSGAPVFSDPDANNNVSFYGIHWARMCFNGVGANCTGGTTNPIYSPWEGIQTDLSLINQCFAPTSGDFTIVTSCIVPVSSTPQANVIIKNNSVLTIPSGVTLSIDFIHHHLLVQQSSGILIKPGGKIP